LLRIGLTGGIACGKSRVLSRLAARGLATLDLDEIARDLLSRGREAYREVIESFGKGILGQHGEIDRKTLASIVFGDAEARARLNGIVHPHVRAAEALVADRHARAGAAVLVSDAALLVESGGHLRFDRIAVVHCGAEQQVARLMRRDRLDAASAEARIGAQMPVAEKRLFAHLEVDTSGSIADTDASADLLAGAIETLASRPAHRPTVALPNALGAFIRGPSRGPRGLTPLDVADAIAEAKGLELAELAGRLVPAATGPWYRAAAATEPVAAWTLAAPLVLWAAGRRHCDPDFLAGAAASLACLTHGRGTAISDACLAALALFKVLVGAAPGGSEKDRRLAEHWGGGSASAAVLSAVASEPSAGLRPEADPGLASLLGGAAAGAPEGEAAPAVVQAIRRLFQLAA
jgi:dephospho-CoA kinase